EGAGRLDFARDKSVPCRGWRAGGVGRSARLPAGDGAFFLGGPARVRCGDCAASGSASADRGLDDGRGAGGGLSAAPAGEGAPGSDPARGMMARLVEVAKLGKEFANVRALDAVTFDVEAGEWIAIMGPSGSGKTTLINILGGLDTPTAGQAVVDGADVARLDEAALTRFRAEKIGFVFQQFHLVPYLTALENVMLAQYFHSTTDENEARLALERVGLGDRLKHLPSRLSGCEHNRVPVARALINHPKLLLADEPTGNLDEANAETVIRLLRELHD